MKIITRGPGHGMRHVPWASGTRSKWFEELSLCVSYSAKQLRRIEQIAKKNAGRERIYSMSLRCHNKNFRALVSIKPSVGVRLTTDQRRRESEDYIQEAEI